MAAIYSNGGNRWNILAFNFTKRDALSSVYKISIGVHFLIHPVGKLMKLHGAESSANCIVVLKFDLNITCTLLIIVYNITTNETFSLTMEY
jgi:hypothetical protein